MELGNCIVEIDGDKLVLVRRSHVENGVEQPPVEFVINGTEHLIQLRDYLVGHFFDTDSTTRYNTLDMEIIKLLDECGIPSHIRGYQYFHEAIRLVYQEPESIHNVTSLVYPHVAKVFNTTNSNVERSMRHSVNSTWKLQIDSGIHQLFSLRPNNAQFIAVLANRLYVQRLTG